EAARAFTGWGHDGDDFVFRRGDHDDGTKTFFGVTGNFDGDDIIAIIFRHPQSSRYIVNKLWSYFAYESPEPAVLESLAQVFRDARGEIRPVMHRMLASRAFYSEKAIG